MSSRKYYPYKGYAVNKQMVSKNLQVQNYDQKYVEYYEKCCSEEEYYYGLYPQACQQYYKYVETYCDRLPRSFFRTPPTSVQITKMSEEIYRLVVKENRELTEDRYAPFGGLVAGLIGALLIGSILRRRRRFFPYYAYYGY